MTPITPGQVRSYSLLHLLYLFLVSRRPAALDAIIEVSVSLERERLVGIHSMLPKPMFWYERIVHWFVNRQLLSLIQGLVDTERLGIAMAILIFTGGENNKAEK